MQELTFAQVEVVSGGFAPLGDGSRPSNLNEDPNYNFQLGGDGGSFLSVLYHVVRGQGVGLVIELLKPSMIADSSAEAACRERGELCYTPRAPQAPHYEPPYPGVGLPPK